MYSDRLYIDGEDAFTQWGAMAEFGCWNQLIAYPPMKAVETNSWQEEDGVEADLSAPVTASREVTLNLILKGLYHDYAGLLETLADGAYHQFHIKSIGLSFKLRLNQCSVTNESATLARLSLRMADDFAPAYVLGNTPATVARYEDYFIDGVPFTSYDCRILEGTLSQLKKTPDVKPNMLRDIKTAAGVIYDAAHVTFKEKEVTLHCLFRAQTLTELWDNYYRLFADLIKPGERTLYAAALEQEFSFYYKSATVYRFYPTDKIWLETAITIVITGGLRLKAGDFLLADNSGKLIFFPDGETAMELHNPANSTNQ